MTTGTSLGKELVNTLTNFRDTVPVFRVRDRGPDELEAEAADFARRFLEIYSDIEPHIHVDRRAGRVALVLPDGDRGRVFTASGAMAVTRGLGALTYPIGEKADLEALRTRAEEVVERLRPDRLPAQDERIEFERLWRINATGMTETGERGPVLVTRAVGAFRRYLHDLPVWGRASVFIKLGGDGIVEAAGIDWRPHDPEPVDQVKPIDPERAAAAVVGELAVATPGETERDDHYAVELFSLGYLSLAKRREQAYLQPVYVAMLRATGWATLNRLVVVPASVTPYEPISRPVAAPPRGAGKPEPGPVAGA